MNFKECISVLYKQWKLICIASVISMLVSGLYSFFFINKAYISSATILLSAYRNDEIPLVSGRTPFFLDKDTTKVYAVLAKSGIILERVINSLGLETDIENLKTLVSVNSIGEGGVLEISAEYQNPYIAQRIVNAIIESLNTEADEMQLLNNIHTIDTAEVPLLPSKPNLMLNIILAFIAAVMASTIYILAFNTSR